MRFIRGLLCAAIAAITTSAAMATISFELVGTNLTTGTQNWLGAEDGDQLQLDIRATNNGSEVAAAALNVFGADFNAPSTGGFRFDGG